MSWIETTKNLGVIKQKSRNTIKYEYIGDKVITNISKGCAKCTKVLGFKDNILEVLYTPNYVPIHLRNNPGYQDARKTIIITYEDGSKDILIITARVIK